MNVERTTLVGDLASELEELRTASAILVGKYRAGAISSSGFTDTMKENSERRDLVQARLERLVAKQEGGPYR